MIVLRLVLMPSGQFLSSRSLVVVVDDDETRLEEDVIGFAELVLTLLAVKTDNL